MLSARLLVFRSWRDIVDASVSMLDGFFLSSSLMPVYAVMRGQLMEERRLPSVKGGAK
jgi:hypothetical protein